MVIEFINRRGYLLKNIGYYEITRGLKIYYANKKFSS